jgi:sortase (surface protein transpeptidase)
VIGVAALAFAGVQTLRAGPPAEAAFVSRPAGSAAPPGPGGGTATNAKPPNGSATAAPTAVKIPSISVHTSLEQLSLRADGSLTPPKFTDAGWYAQGTAPGDVGPAVIAGHVDSTSGPSVFYRLKDIHTGDHILVERGGRWLTFTVTSVGRYPKTNFPTSTVYGPTPTAELRLITCGGAFNNARESYDDNIVVYARETA